MSSVLAIDLIDGTLRHDSVAEHLGDGVHVLVLEHESLVDFELGEAELVQVGQCVSESGVVLLGDLLVVEGLWSLDLGGEGDLALHEAITRLVAWLEGRSLFFLFLNDWLLKGHVHSGWLLRLHDKDVAPDLVTELDVSGLHSEEAGVAALLFRSLALDSHFAVSFRLDLVADQAWLGSDIVASGLEELYVGRP